MNAFSFAAPYSLWALLALPLLWWWLRWTPPRPQTELFPPLRLLRGLQGAETQALRCPWWLTLLRLLLAALMILAFARPVQNRSLPVSLGGKALVILLDNGFAAYSRKESIKAQAQRLIAAAAAAGSPIYIIPALAAADAAIGPYNGAEAQALTERLSYLALPVRRDQAFARLAELAGRNPGGFYPVYLTDGLATAADKTAFAALQKLSPAAMLWYLSPPAGFVGINAAENSADGLHFTLIRAAGSAPALTGRIAAYDEKGQILAEQDFHFAAGAEKTQGVLALPAAMRNDMAWLRLLPSGQAGERQRLNAAGLRLLDTRNRQKTVAILAPEQSRLAQPLLSPLYYVAKALENAPQIAGGKAVQADGGSFEHNSDRLLAARPDLLIMGDIAAIPAAAQGRLRRFVEEGGTLLRFAGPALANADKSGGSPAESLLPVPLRRGERSFGGALSWEKPQKPAAFSRNSPFYGLAVPQDVLVYRQILAEPAAGLPDTSWVTLADGTPLVSGLALGKGRLVFVHTGLENTWSNLALSGFFVDMLHRLAAGSGGGDPAPLRPAPGGLAPYRLISAEGLLEAAPDTARALTVAAGRAPEPDFYHPPGFYGARPNFYALNLLNNESRFTALQPPPLPAVRVAAYAAPETNWQNRLFIAAACLFIVDTLLSLLKSGSLKPPPRSGRFRQIFAGFSARLRRQAGRLAAPRQGRVTAWKRRIIALIGLAAGLALGAAFMLAPAPAAAAPERGEHNAVLAGKTRLAYVITGKAEIDAVSKAGLQNLSRFIERRTTIEPGEVAGLDPARDELAFYPLIYWPIDAQAPMPPPQAIDNMDAYMRHGGTIVFDTRDALQTGLQLDGAGANTGRLRAILAGLNVPPLIPAPPEHVIARSFYIMPDFPGRYRTSPLWIAAGSDAAANGGNPPIRAGDGVSAILITANDFAAAWADDGAGGFLFPLVPDGEDQRLWAFRGGLNIVMYILTGNYKADQMHMPELLRRLSP